MIFATSYYNFASIYKGLGDVELAKEYQQRALDIQLDKLDPEHVNIATIFNNFALSYQHLVEFEEAKKYQPRAIDIQLDKLGPEHVNVSTGFNNFALIHQHLSDCERFEPWSHFQSMLSLIFRVNVVLIRTFVVVFTQLVGRGPTERKYGPHRYVGIV